jgi:UV excision repair protein RAD23
MLLSFRTLTNAVYQIETDLSQTIESTKIQLSPVCGHPPSLIRLLYKGKVLLDNQTLTGAGVDGSAFVLLQPMKPAQPKVDPPAPPPVVCLPAPITPVLLERPSVEPLPDLPTMGIQRPPGFEEKLDALVSLGFGRGDCEGALRSSRGNVDEAAHFLLSGQVAQLEPAVAQCGSDSDEVVLSDWEDEEEDDSELSRYTQYRNALASDPGYLREFLRQMSTENPGLASLIRNDPEAFLGTIGLNPDNFDLRGLGPQATQYDRFMVDFSDPEKKSIRALQQLGIDTMTIIQVFVACDKNEALTRECLLSMQ